MKIGLIARADNGGLGVQTYEFYRNMPIHKTLIIDISAYNNLENFYYRYPEAQVVKGFPRDEDLNDFLEDLDVVFSCEIPYNYNLFNIARKKGIKTVLQYNYEFLDYLQSDLPFPDLLLAPSLWHFEEIEERFSPITSVRFLPVPVNRDVLPFEEKIEIKKFLHIAGHKTAKDRNGTQIVLDSLRYITEPVEVVIRSQQEIPKVKKSNKVKLKVITDEVHNYWELYGDEDCLLLPRRYGGLSLQLNEAMSKGMIPIMTDIEPQNRFLHSESLIEPVSQDKLLTRTEIDVWNVDPYDLAKKINQFAQLDKFDVEDLNKYSDDYANRISWTNMKHKYLRMFEDVCKEIK